MTSDPTAAPAQAVALFKSTPTPNGSSDRRAVSADHVIVFSAAGSRRPMKRSGGYYEQSRTPLSLNQDAPIARPIVAPGAGRIVAIPQIGGLYHRYDRRGGGWCARLGAHDARVVAFRRLLSIFLLRDERAAVCHIEL